MGSPTYLPNYTPRSVGLKASSQKTSFNTAKAFFTYVNYRRLKLKLRKGRVTKEFSAIWNKHHPIIQLYLPYLV